jgi:hypothetical protein
VKEFQVSTKLAVRPVLNTIEMLVLDALDKGLEMAVISVSRQIRTDDQNRLLWPLLRDWSEQVTHIDGNRYSAHQWKDILTSAFEGAVSFAPNLHGTGLIAFGARTSQYNKKKFSDFIEFIFSEGCERGIKWSERSDSSINEARGKYGCDKTDSGR